MNVVFFAEWRGYLSLAPEISLSLLVEMVWNLDVPILWFFFMNIVVMNLHAWITYLLLGALAFDVEYARWLEEQSRRINELRGAVNSRAGDAELRIIVEGVISHYDDLFRIKGEAAKADVFHILSGMWRTPAERCFLWLGGFRSSELLEVIQSLQLLHIHVPYLDSYLLGAAFHSPKSVKEKKKKTFHLIAPKGSWKRAD